MKIKTQVSVSLIIFVILAVLIIFSVYSSNSQFQEMSKKEQIINEIEKDSFELYFLENEYLLHSGTRPVEQWNSKYDEVSGHLKELTVTDPDQQIVLSSLLDNQAELHTTFSNLVAVTVSAQGKEAGSASQRVREFAASTLTGQTQMMMSRSSELSQMIKAENLRIHERTTLVFSSSIAVLMIFVFLNYFLINRSVLRSVSTLQKGAKKIGTGDLDTKIETGTSDELGDLSLAITAMASNLKAVLTSRSELEKEVAERKRAEEQLKESETRYREFFTTSRDCVFITSPDGRFIDFNDATLEMFGYDNREEMSKVSIPFLYAHSEDRSVFLNQIIRDGYVKEFPAQLKRQDGTVIDSLITGVPLRNPDGTIKALIGTARDITERKRAEEALRETTEYLQNLFDYANAPIITWDPGFHITRFNHAFEHLTGRSQEEVLGKTLDLLFPDESRKASMVLIQKTLEGERWETVEIPILNTDGSTKTVLWNSANILDSEGKLTATIAQGFDITERKQLEERIADMARFHEGVIGNANVWLTVLDATGKILVWNRAAEKISGYHADEVIGKKDIWRALYPDKNYRGRITGAITRIIAERNYLENFESEIKIKDGGTRIMSWNTRGMTGARGKDERYITIGLDITERKRAEIALRENEILLNEVGVMAHVGGWELDVKTKAVHWTKETYRIHDISEDEKFDLSRAVLFFDMPDRSRLEAALQCCMENGEPFDLEILFTSAKGRHLWTRAMGRAVNVDGEVVKLEGTFQDITDRKRTEEEIQLLNATLEQRVRDRTQELEQATETIRASLDEKVILLREIHHRVKNNLQILISLLNLQSRTFTDPQVNEALKESTQRIRAMSMVHEKLYTGSDLAHIDFISYLSSLAKSQVAFYGLSPGKVTLETTGENIMLDINTAIPLGLVMNELVSNALKHAFPGDRKGIIRIDTRETEGQLEITFADNGIGIPEGFDWKTAPSLGLRLVTILIEQLSGTITLDRTKAGTVFSIVVKKKE